MSNKKSNNTMNGGAPGNSPAPSAPPAPPGTSLVNPPGNSAIQLSTQTKNNLTELLKDFGYTNSTANSSNPDLNPSFNEVLSKLTKSYRQFGLPQAPASVMDPAFGKNSIDDITKLYQKVYLPAIDNYAKSHVGDPNTLQLLRFFGLIQLVLFRSLSMVDMYSLLRSKYEKKKVTEIFDNISGILNKLNDKGVEVKSYKDQIESYKQVINSLAPGTKQIALATAPVTAAAAGGGRKKRAPKSKAKAKSKKSSKGKRTQKKQS